MATLLAVRELIFDCAAANAAVGSIEEALKWGEPAYLTGSKIGSTIRLNWRKDSPGLGFIYFICSTNLVDSFRALFPHDLQCQGNRAIVLDVQKPLPEQPLRICLTMALTYHLSKQH